RQKAREKEPRFRLVLHNPVRRFGFCTVRLSFPLFFIPFSFLLTGCVSTGSFLQWNQPTVQPCRVVAAGNPAVVLTPDPAHDGTPNPGLAGRIYLFGPEIGCPVLGNGSLHVALLDDMQCACSKDSAPLEEWHFDPETLKRLRRHDPVGWGYTV